jgi:hypothetical protein
LTDKSWSKGVVASAGLAELAVPILWSGTELPDEPPAALPLIVKSNHGCNQFVLVRTPADWDEARRRAPRWLASSYGEWLDERQYRSARRVVLVEPFLGGAENRLPDDYKVYVFGGRAAIVQHHVGRRGNHRWTQFDRAWQRVGGAASECPAPANLERMIGAAERLAGSLDFLRVDFYEVDGRLWFGEFCLFPGSGLDRFDPLDLDAWLGKLWAEARGV